MEGKEAWLVSTRDSDDMAEQSSSPSYYFTDRR